MDTAQFDLWPGDETDHDAETPVQSTESVITEIEPDAAWPHRQLVHLDDRQCLSVHDKVLRALALGTGQKWARRDLARQCRELETKCAQEAAIALLTRRSRSVADLGKRLRRKGFSASAWSAVIKRLTELRLLDDERFAVDLHETLLRRESLGRRAILDRMQREGLPRDLAMRVTEERTADETEAQRALELARKRLSRMSAIDPTKARQRVYGYLVRHGFSSGHAASAVKEALAASADADVGSPADADAWDAGA